MADIDFVVMWVDNSDPIWQAEKEKYMSNDIIDCACSDNRFRDWGLMRYWFRAVEQFAPWVHKVFFVTYGHIPSFLNLNANKLVVVKHDDFMPEEYLPTFSSRSIEMNLHRIQGLSEQFVLFNDDTFLLRPIAPKVFFKNQLPCAYFAEVPFQPKFAVGGGKNIFQNALYNDISILNRNFKKQDVYAHNRKKIYSIKYSLRDIIRTLIMENVGPNNFSGFKIFHCPTPYLISVYKQIWEKEFNILDCTSRNRFRSINDVNQYLSLWWQLLSGQFEPSKIDSVYFLINDNTIRDIVSTIERQPNDMICLNDGDVPVDVDSLSKQIQDAFEKILPEKCSFEK